MARKPFKRVVFLHGEVKTPPFSEGARIAAGLLLRRLQGGEMLVMPHSRPMPDIGSGCHELRIRDHGVQWRIVYRLDPDAVVILDVFQKTTRTTPDHVRRECTRRLRQYDQHAGG